MSGGHNAETEAEFRESDMQSRPVRPFSHRETYTERRGCVDPTPSRTLCLRLRGS